MHYLKGKLEILALDVFSKGYLYFLISALYFPTRPFVFS